MAATYKTAHGAHPLLKSNEYFILMICFFFDRTLYTYLHCNNCCLCYKVQYSARLAAVVGDESLSWFSRDQAVSLVALDTLAEGR